MTNSSKFYRILGLSDEQAFFPPVSWHSPLLSLIDNNNKSEMFTLRTDFLDEDDRQRLPEYLNKALSKALQEEQQSFFKILKDVESGTEDVVLYYGDLAVIERKGKSPADMRGVCKIILNYYEAFLEYETAHLFKEAFNLPLRHEEDTETWGHAGFHAEEIVSTYADGRQVKDRVLYPSRTGNILHMDRTALIEKDVSDAFARAMTFLEGSAFLEEWQWPYVRILAGLNPITRVYHSGGNSDNYGVAFDMNVARRLVEAGIQVDLYPVMDFHLKRGFGGPVAGWSTGLFSEQESAVRAFRRCFNLAAAPGGFHRLEHQGVKLAGFSGNSTHLGYYSNKTGQPVYEDGRSAAYDLSFTVDMGFDFLDLEHIQGLADDLNAALRHVLDEKGIDASTVAFPSVVNPYGEYRISVPYETLDLMLRNGIVLDAAPVFDRHLQDIKDFIDAESRVGETLAKATGMKWSGTDFVRKRREHARIYKEHAPSISLGFKNDSETTRADYPEPVSIYEKDVRRLSDVLDAAGLREDVKARCNAVRWAGGMTGNHVSLEIEGFSIEQAQGVADRLLAAADRLQPLLRQIARKSAIECIFDQEMFGYPQQGTERYQLMMDIAYAGPVADIERILQGKSADEDMDDKACRRVRQTLGGTVDYLVRAERHPGSEEIRKIAGDHLETMAGLSPFVARIIEESRCAQQPKALPAPSGPAPM